jgi:FecR protein
MTVRWLAIFLVSLFATLSAAQVASAAAIGKVVAVVGTPNASGPGGSRILKSGADVFEDDRITVGGGNAQIVLIDNTRLVLGPGSTLVLDKFLLKNKSTASKISIKALRGTFRFITGKSPKSAYDIRTAHATIGIRGTGFDFWVRGQTGVAVMLGRVRLCNGPRCVELRDTCDVGIAGGGSARRPGGREATRVIAQNLPFIANQRALRAAFRLPVEKCSRRATGADDRNLTGGGGKQDGQQRGTNGNGGTGGQDPVNGNNGNTGPVNSPPTTVPKPAPTPVVAPSTDPVIDPVNNSGSTPPAPNPVPEPPAATDPVTAPPATTDPVTEPPATPEPAIAPPATTDPVTAPPATTDPVTAPPATTDPVTAPPATTDPATAPPASTDPVSEPPVTNDPVTAPSVNSPPAAADPATAPDTGTTSETPVKVGGG